MDAKGNTIVGESYVFLENDCHSSECGIGNLIADAMIESVSKIDKKLTEFNKLD